MNSVSTFAGFKSLKIKLIVYFMSIFVIISISISLYYYYNQKQSIESNTIKNSYDSINYLLNNVDKQLKLCDKLADWIYINRDIGRILSRDYNGDKNKYNIDIPVVQRLLEDTVGSSSIGGYISSLIIMGDNGVVLSIGIDSDWIDKEELKNALWFKDAMDKNGRVYWNGIIENPATIKHDKYIIPIVRPVIFADTRKKIGWCMIGFKPDLISDVFENYELSSNQSIFIIDQKGTCIFHNDPMYIGKQLKQYDFIDTVLLESSGNFNTYLDNKKTLVSFLKSNYSGMTIVNILSYEQLEEQKRMVKRVTISIILLSILISSTFTVFLSSRLTKPLINLLNRMKCISSGDFTRDPSLEGSDEMGILGKGINDMAENLDKLMKQLLKKEEEKKKLEFKMLQSQINPHFIYNTLNSIKLMATIQGADGIREMVSALGLLLKEVSKGTSEKITLREEIKLVESYVYIQKIRRKGMIRMHYDIPDESILDYKILKFTLQPIIENAIFHGLEPKKGIGNIKIEIREENDRIIISIEDDGIGMSKQRINEILLGNNKKKSTEFSSIGIKNIDERLKLIYGQQYGLKLKSKKGKYTRVSIIIPKEV